MDRVQETHTAGLPARRTYSIESRATFCGWAPDTPRMQNKRLFTYVFIYRYAKQKARNVAIGSTTIFPSTRDVGRSSCHSLSLFPLPLPLPLSLSHSLALSLSLSLPLYPSLPLPLPLPLPPSLSLSLRGSVSLSLSASASVSLSLSRFSGGKRPHRPLCAAAVAPPPLGSRLGI